MRGSSGVSDPENFRIVFADLDGTLLDSTGAISDRCQAALARLPERGCALAICTGRSRHAAERVARLIAGCAYAVVLNGAVTVDLRNGAVLRKRLLVRSVAVRASDLAAEFGHAAVWMGAEEHGSAMAICSGAAVWPPFERRNRERIRRVPSFEALSEAPASLAVYGTESDAVALAAMWDRAFDREALAVAGPTAAYEGWYAQLTAMGAEKAAAAAHLAEALGISRERTLAIGDHLNDVELLKWAGLGVAMADGHPSAIAAADYVTGSLEEEGAALAIERLILGIGT